MSKTYSAGIVTAYGAAKRAGYQGTYEDFCRQQAGYAESAAAVEQAKNTAVSAANTATTKAGEATTAATDAQTAKTQTEAAASQALTDISTARSGAISAVQTEGQTQTANARAQAQAAAGSATTAGQHKDAAATSATNAASSATDAAAFATSAANAASAALGVLESIPQDYSDLSSDVDQLKADLTSNVNYLKSVIANATGYEAISFTNRKYIKTNLNVGDLVDLTPITAYNTNNYAIVDAQEGDKFTINATGGNAGRLWCFIDSNNVLLSVAASGAIATNLILTAPANASKLILNPVSGYGEIYKGESLVDVANGLENHVNALNTSVGTLAEELNGVRADVGDLSNLDTTDKSSIVAAINEAAQTGGSGGTVTYDLPKLTIYGDISVSNKDAETKAYQYVWENPAENEQRTGYCSLKWQGESSLTYPKKNYTIKFFADAKYKRKDKQSFFDKLILVKNKWVLKAHWVDRSMARNIVSCRLWGQMVKSRDSAPEEHLAQAPNFGAINGFPIKVYVNDEFHGLYDFNIPKDADLFAMDEENPLHCAICGDSQSGTGSTAFRQATASGWELEVPDAWQSYTVEEDGQTVTKYVADGLVALINFVMTATDVEFKADLNNYLDVESAIDYYLFCYLACGIDSLGRNLLMVTYDGGNKWYCSLYDADTTWGNGLVGAGTYNATLPCPEMYEMKTSLLWERMETCFGNELYARWTALRTNIFKAEYLKNEFALFWNLVPEEYYEMDIEKWPTIPQWNIDFDVRIPQFIDARLPYCDAEIWNMRERIPCTGITLSDSAITFSSGSPVTITATATPENTTDDVVWTCSDDTVCTVDNGVVTPLKNGTATITATCGSQSATCSVTVNGLSFNISLSGGHATLTGTGSVNPNSSYTGTLTADTGYEFESVMVTMGGTDITATAYSNGTVSIASVTGDVVVTAVAVFSEDTTGLQYKLASPFTMDGTKYRDTGFLYNATDSLTIAVDMTQPDDVSTSDIYIFGAMRNGTSKVTWTVSYRGIRGLHNQTLASGLPGTARDRIKSVIRYNATTGVVSIRSTHRDSVTGNMVEVTQSYSHATISSPTPTRDAFVNSLYIGGLHGANGLEGAAQSGTIHDLRILTRRWTDAEVMNWLGVDNLSTRFTDDMDGYVPA